MSGAGDTNKMCEKQKDVDEVPSQHSIAASLNVELTDTITISKFTNLNPGSSYEVIFNAINVENNFYVNLVSLMYTMQELTFKINEYCNLQQQMYIKSNAGDVLLAKSITDCIWYRSKIIQSTGFGSLSIESNIK